MFLDSDEVITIKQENIESYAGGGIKKLNDLIMHNAKNEADKMDNIIKLVNEHKNLLKYKSELANVDEVIKFYM